MILQLNREFPNKILLQLYTEVYQHVLILIMYMLLVAES